jgi:hypothetical protein
MILEQSVKVKMLITIKIEHYKGPLFLLGHHFVKSVRHADF